MPAAPQEQQPTKSTIRATNSLPLARSVARSVNLPALPDDGSARADQNTSSALLKARELAGLDAQDGVDRQRLLRYYVHCLSAQAASGMLPDRDSGRGSAYFLLGQGSETIQSGLGPSLPAPSQLPRPKSTGARSTEGAGLQEYWYGYPAITLPERGGDSRRRAAVRIAPLLIQSMELAPDEDGRDRLRPNGVPSLHTGLITDLLDDEAAADLLARWQPTWQEGNGTQMVRAVRELLTELGVPELEPFDLSALSERSVMDSLRPGAHNAAVLLAPSGVERIATEALVDNLLQMSTRTAQIPGTALDAILTGGYEADMRREALGVVAPGPCNESQELVIRSAMTRPLTVATGPPGTGKSEVVTAVVATAVAAGQTVLVASTNNEAVDVVAARCDAISPGLLMRTGNAAALEREAAKLEELLEAGPSRPPGAGRRPWPVTCATGMRDRPPIGQKRRGWWARRRTWWSCCGSVPGRPTIFSWPSNWWKGSGPAVRTTRSPVGRSRPGGPPMPDGSPSGDGAEGGLSRRWSPRPVRLRPTRGRRGPRLGRCRPSSCSPLRRSWRWSVRCDNSCRGSSARTRRG